MRDVIEKVLAAESEARGILKSAKTEADGLLESARRQAAAILEQARREARAQAGEIESAAEVSAAARLRTSLAAAKDDIEKGIRLDAAARGDALASLLRCVSGTAGELGTSSPPV